LVVLQLSGDPNDPAKLEMNMAEVVKVLQHLGVRDAILGGTSGDVQRYWIFGSHRIRSAGSRAGSIVALKASRPDGYRGLGTALLFYRRVNPARARLQRRFPNHPGDSSLRQAA